MSVLVTTLKQKSNRNFLFRKQPDFHVLLVFRHVIFALFLILMRIQNHSVYCQLDSNINTLRYDGEVNIGKITFY